MRLHIAMLACELFGGFHELQHGWVLNEVLIHILLRGGARNTEVIRQTKRAHAVNQAEVDHFGHTPLVKRNVFQLNAKNLRGGTRVYVVAISKRVQQPGVLRQMREDTQFNLRVVGRHHDAIRRRDKGGADFSPQLSAHGDILQIWLVRGQASGHGDRLRIVGMHAPRARLDHARQRVGVGRFEFGQATVFKHGFGQRIVLGEFLQHFFVGARRAFTGFFHHGHAEFFKEDFADLFRTVEVKRLSG